MPTAGPFKGILAKGTGDLVDPATGFANTFVADIFLVFGLAKSQRKLSEMVHIDTIDTKFSIVSRLYGIFRAREKS
ncbi:Uncharacterized protein DBV15_05851 [Temnothorax longispinosus]|uniref:Uncharacterized protein n=1 Tax=Temnothorax longispinosus TaxID=300112 RepID=A0A4S2JLW1_9HYME|nr:Uncharacterized protein DBV15_05851 [Temnothorax longispinosus]